MEVARKRSLGRGLLWPRVELEVRVQKQKPARGGLFFFFYPKFRIPSLDGFTARFWREFWRGSACVSAVVTFVRAAGA
jgi:hypothetical protein